ncbi:MAG: 50S ribosomal protein L29 [Clostridia bacterium]|nr:50S ribosomal protein L29 [Clostridia bacterium]
MKARDIREMSVAELETKLKDLKTELFNLRFQHAINQLDNPHKIEDTKRDIARVMTILQEKKA